MTIEVIEGNNIFGKKVSQKFRPGEATRGSYFTEMADVMLIEYFLFHRLPNKLL